jgi:hypothetical protein
VVVRPVASTPTAWRLPAGIDAAVGSAKNSCLEYL